MPKPKPRKGGRAEKTIYAKALKKTDTVNDIRKMSSAGVGKDNDPEAMVVFRVDGDVDIYSFPEDDGTVKGKPRKVSRRRPDVIDRVLPQRTDPNTGKKVEPKAIQMTTVTAIQHGSICFKIGGGMIWIC